MEPTLYRDPNDRFTVFIIGPMDKTSRGLSMIKEATLSALKTVGLTEDDFDVQTPTDLSGSEIVDKVFHPIDAADFVIADITNRSPNVFYEIAFFHTLGTPILYFDKPDESGERQSLPFYFRNTDIRQLDEKDLNVETIAAILTKDFRAYFAGDRLSDLTQNPISRFYEVPLMDISAATGLAVGYFDNFLKPTLQTRTGALAWAENKLDKLIIARPISILSSDEDEKAINRAIPGTIQLTAVAPAHRRGKIFLSKVKNGYAIDLPTPLYTLYLSPRYRSLNKRLERIQNFDVNLRERLLRKMEKKMISAFFATLQYLIRNERDLSVSSFEICSVTDLEEKAKEWGLAE